GGGGVGSEGAVGGGDGGTAQLAAPGPAARLVAPEDPGVALEALAQRARPGLHVAGALAGVQGAQVAAEVGEGLVRASRVRAGDVDVQGSVAARGGPLPHGDR